MVAHTAQRPVRSAARRGGLRLHQLRGYLAQSRRAPTVALTVTPLVLLYGLGLLAASPRARAGADLVSGALMGQLGRQGYAVAVAGVAGALVAFAAWRLRGATLRRAALLGPVLVESLAYAALLGGAVLVVLDEGQLLGPGAGVHRWLDRVVLAAGAGLHEELLFRLLAVPGIAAVARGALAMPRALAWAVAIVVAAALFAAAHHVLGGEPFDRYAFTFRMVAGVLLGALWYARGFAVAAWTHATYDLLIFSGLG